MNVLTLAGYLIILGMLIAVAGYSIYQRFLAGKIAVYIFTKERRLYRRLIKPGSLNELNIEKKTYVYDETAIFYTPIGLLGQPKPALIYHRDEPAPVDMFNRTRTSGYSSEELNSMMNDSTVRDFVSAQSSIQPKQIITAVIAMGVIVCALILGSTYYIMTNGRGLDFMSKGGS